MKMPDRTKAAVAARRQKIKEMAEASHSLTDIAQATGISTDRVSQLAHEMGVKLVHERTGFRLRAFRADQLMEGIVAAATPSPTAVAMMEGHYEELDRGLLDEWVRGLDNALVVLNGVNLKLKSVRRKAKNDGRGTGAEAEEVASPVDQVGGSAHCA